MKGTFTITVYEKGAHLIGLAPGEVIPQNALIEGDYENKTVKELFEILSQPMLSTHDKETKLEGALREERKRSEDLWGILDSIDTLPDMIHPNTKDGHEKCWKMMVKRAGKRHDILITDGYKLSSPPEDKETKSANWNRDNL